MARQRRGGFRPEIRGTLGTLLRTTLAQASVVRDALERGAREGRSRLDEARANRRRHDTLAELGEIVLELIRRGEIDPAELPEVKNVVAHLDELDASADGEPDVAAPPSRTRFDDRDGTVSSSDWSPPARRKRGDTKIWKPKTSASSAPAASGPRAPLPKKGGISFEDDDLAEYMHPEDVPPKKGDS